MVLDGITAMTVICVIFAIGDFVSAKTKAMCSMMLVSAVLLLIGFQTNVLPRDMFEVSLLLPVGGILIAFLITHMGTLMSIRELIDQWKTLIISVAAMVGIGLIMALVGPLFMDRIYAVTGAPAVAGGIVAAIIMSEAAKEIGLADAALFAPLIVAIQGLVGFPIASLCLRKEAENLKKRIAENGGKPLEAAVVVKEKKYLVPPLPESIRGSGNVLMAKLGIAAIIAIMLSNLTNGVIHRFVMCLIVGLLLKELGILEESIMVKANSFGYGMIAILVVIFGDLAKATTSQLVDMALPLVMCFVLSVIGMAVFSIIAGKLLKLSPYMSMAIGASTMVGFPGTFIISNEVAKSMGETEEEKKMILDYILPKMLVAGFATVTVGSVIMASLMVNLIK